MYCLVLVWLTSTLTSFLYGGDSLLCESSGECAPLLSLWKLLLLPALESSDGVLAPVSSGLLWHDTPTLGGPEGSGEGKSSWKVELQVLELSIPKYPHPNPQNL